MEQHDQAVEVNTEIADLHREAGFIVRDIEPGETIQRSYTDTYPLALQRHGFERDYSVIPEALYVLDHRPIPDSRYHRAAVLHLQNAANERLHRKVRVEHFDIALARIVWGTGDMWVGMAHPAAVVLMRGGAR